MEFFYIKKENKMKNKLNTAIAALFLATTSMATIATEMDDTYFAARVGSSNLNLDNFRGIIS